MQVHASNIWVTYQYIRVHMSDIRMTQVHMNDIRMTYEYIQVTSE